MLSGIAKDVRAKMVAGGAQLLAQRGLQGTSFSEVLELTGAPRGSVYHHFPGGKDELVTAAVEAAGQFAMARMEQARGSSPEAVTERFVGLWRELLDRSAMTAGCAVVAVTVAADSDGLLDQAATTFKAWNEHLAGLFVAGGADPARAAVFATVLIAATEGAVVLARAARDRTPFDTVAQSLLAQARAL